MTGVPGGRRAGARSPHTVHRTALLILVALFLGPVGHAQVARLSLADRGDTVRVGEPFRVLLTVRPPAGAFPILPTPAPGARRDSFGLTLGDARVLALARRPPHVAAGVRVDSALYTVAVFALDSARVGPVSVGLVAGSDTGAVDAAAITVRIAATTAAGDSLRPPAPPLEMPRAWGPWAIGLAAGAVALGLGTRALRRRRSRPPRPSPHAHLPPYGEALARLNALDSARVDSDAAVEAHHVELSDTVRTYLERSLGIAAHRLTTAELAVRLQQQALPADARDSVAGILRETDMVKFAARRPSPEALAGTRARTRMALAVLEETLAGGGQ